METCGKKHLFGWLNHHWSSYQNPMQFLTTWLLFKKKCKWHIYVFCDLSVSQLAWCIGLCDPASGRAGRKWDRHLSDFFPLSLCLHPGRNPQDSSKYITQSESCGWRCLWPRTRVSNNKRTSPQLPVRLWQKEGNWQSMDSIPPKKSPWGLWRDFGEMFWKKNMWYAK